MTDSIKPGKKPSELKVLESAAGYYIGRNYYDADVDCFLPYSRESVEYFDSHDVALLALLHGNYTRRGHP